MYPSRSPDLTLLLLLRADSHLHARLVVVLPVVLVVVRLTLRPPLLRLSWLRLIPPSFSLYDCGRGRVTDGGDAIACAGASRALTFARHAQQLPARRPSSRRPPPRVRRPTPTDRRPRHPRPQPQRDQRRRGRPRRAGGSGSCVVCPSGPPGQAERVSAPCLGVATGIATDEIASGCLLQGAGLVGSGSVGHGVAPLCSFVPRTVDIGACVARLRAPGAV